jgi:hypothetical protein
VGTSPNFAQFRPRKEIAGMNFVGGQVCAGCHAQKSRSHSRTAMAHALQQVRESSVLQSHPRITFQAGRYSYEIVSHGNQSFYRVSDGKETINEPIFYVFGNGKIAQTFVLRRNGKLYEGRVSYYTGIDGLDWTIGDALNPPPSLEEAFGRDIDSDEARNCFSCHGTAATVENKLHLDSLVPGVGCEACHGPGEQHVAAMRSGKGEDLHIFNPETLDPESLSQEFCGACHRSADTVGMMPNLGGIGNVRFQPYRISNSPGHDTNDKHFACTFCHDPHVDLKQQDASNDSKCTVCHVLRGPAQPSNTSRPASERTVRQSTTKACPVASEGCVTCHMPKVELPGAHFKFTDHRIRIAKQGETYPL